ncbi:hypothetical protein HDU99_006591, partial [Rhizoclosmatium hyalinum]
MSHHHSHSHSGACGHESHDHDHNHDHDHDGPDRGAEFTLYKHIDIDNIRTFNEAVPGSGKTVFKSYEERLDDSKNRVKKRMNNSRKNGGLTGLDLMETDN